MATEVDLTTVDRAVLIAIIAQLQATVLERQRVIERLERRIAELEGQAKSGRQPPVKQQPRKQRRHGFARRRMTPTQRVEHVRVGHVRVEHVRVEHVMENGPDCGTHLTGGWTQRTRKSSSCRWLRYGSPSTSTLLGLARLGLARRAGAAARPRRDWTVWFWDGSAAASTCSGLVATLREEARMPFPTIQRYLDTVQQRRVSAGAIVGAIRQTAPKAQPMVAGILDRVRASPVVHADETGPTKPGRRNRADETGWRQSGANGYVWTFSTPTERYFLRRGRGKTVVDEALNDAFSGVLVSDCYAAYHHYDGPKQRCWAHLLRDIHDLRARYPDAAPLARWADAVHGIYDRAKACTPPQAKPRRTAQLALERQLLAICQPFLDDPSATQAKLCRRIERFVKELCVFVAEPDVPGDNNAAERSLRHLVVSRKISGGTRSERGTERKLTLASIFGAWRAQGLNPLAACRQLLISPQL